MENYNVIQLPRQLLSTPPCEVIISYIDKRYLSAMGTLQQRSKAEPAPWHVSCFLLPRNENDISTLDNFLLSVRT